MQSALTKLAGVQSAKVNLKTGEVLVRFDADKVKPEEMANTVTKRGFESHVKNPKNGKFALDPSSP